ncbi:MAG: hypothetical protein M3209_01045 [Acidobacteriota bacterium]|nr:hypothetical protein [Acidobacteriota bacterium]
MNRLMPNARWHTKLMPKIMRFLFLAPIKNLYRAGRWLVIRIFTTQPDYRFHEMYLENFPVTPLEFYAAIEQAFFQRQIIGASVSRVARLEWHLLSARRIYLLIRFREAVCFIGGVPLGTGFLVSWRYTAEPSKALLILFQIPYVGVIAECLLKPVTFYRADVYRAFEQAVRATVLEAANRLTDRGVRPLTETEQRPLLREFYG